ncbi:MAG: hypothetical protein UW68_C0017G0003 [Candidatus Collierbacteria bacterium GW2011_GWB1_44_6]|uniref:Uncharacterized protein n=2 Tax=Candidatus Collieribacteriota TaxID=1752725 RepID=A0A0G1JNZ6_9BACT|nr:MAG: hypothetical protein UV68_C0002G0019 [Candidatus Collierbacteria bacterium GW2011_GWC2_43_12]KKT73068.1 MAG: hypothetical protein UW68_C0017G0003 [Candidatus Collierbacteria bacterium GW2011_GWB1_44_6]KKT83203.1 MAG: hypothetical protein UW80_C0019G0013 [Microgenomates group bacterium GW2011_GWC1_44_9]
MIDRSKQIFSLMRLSFLRNYETKMERSPPKKMISIDISVYNSYYSTYRLILGGILA